MAQTSVRDHYQIHGLHEWRRLVKDPFHRLELDTTMHFLEQHLPPSGSVLSPSTVVLRKAKPSPRLAKARHPSPHKLGGGAGGEDLLRNAILLDAGGGPGRYSIALAKRGYDVVLLDLTPALLELARRRITQAGVKRRVSTVEGSIVDLSLFPSDHFDAALCLGGPLSHVATEEERRQAVRELVRVTRPGAPVFISVMGRLAVLSESPRYWPAWVDHTTGFTETWRDGDDHHWFGSSYAHFFLPEELLTLVEESRLEIVQTVGLEGLGSHAVAEINRLARKRSTGWKNWLEMHAALCTHPSVFATSQHMLVIGRKPES